MKNKILFLEGEKPATYAAMRSCSQAGYHITAITHLKISIAHYSRYVNQVIQLPNIDDNPEEYKLKLIDEIRKGEIGRAHV